VPAGVTEGEDDGWIEELTVTKVAEGLKRARMSFRRRICTVLMLSAILSGPTLRAASAQSLATALQETSPSTCNRSAFRVVIDVGHTNDAGGALSARGVFEYDYNLRLAGEIEQSLIDAGFAKTVLVVTTQRPTLGLHERAAVANGLRADLFLSIHHDAVPDRLLETWEYEGTKYQYCDRFKGHSIFVSHDNPDYAGSLQFGEMLGASLKARGLQYTPHYVEPIMGSRRRTLVDVETGVYRYDQLIVLRQTRMPAVLLEAGSIVNRDEELVLRTPERQAVITQAATEAVEKFCTARAARHPLLSARTMAHMRH
jgi:N-acetylmuramoyl-L-alanine amidase